MTPRLKFARAGVKTKKGSPPDTLIAITTLDGEMLGGSCGGADGNESFKRAGRRGGGSFGGSEGGVVGVLWFRGDGAAGERGMGGEEELRSGGGVQ